MAFASIASLTTAVPLRPGAGASPDAAPICRFAAAGWTRTLHSGQERLRAVLVVAEIALALILLTGAGLMIQSVLRLRAVDPGFRPDNVVALTVNLPQSRYRSAAALHAFHRDTVGQLAALPEVEVAGAVNWRPLGEILMQRRLSDRRRPVATRCHRGQNSGQSAVTSAPWAFG